MPSPNNVLTADSYVQDGLVFQLDGIEYGGIDGRWIDRKNNCVYDISMCDKDKMSVIFNRHFAPLIENHYNFSANNCTVETIYDSKNLNDYQHILACSTRSYVSSFITYNNIFGRNVNAAARYQNKSPFSLNSKNILYAGIQKGVHNGYSCEINVGVSFNTSSKSGLGAIHNGSYYQYLFIGSIYAIRIYSRQLSDREILINQKIDNARFGLGLNIPDEVIPATRSLSLSEPYELPDESMTEQDITNETSDER